MDLSWIKICEKDLPISLYLKVVLKSCQYSAFDIFLIFLMTRSPEYI